MKFWDWNQIKAEEVTSSQWKKSLDAENLEVSMVELLEGARTERADPDHRAGNSGAAGRVAGAGPERRGYGAGQPDAGDTAVRRILGAGAEDHVVRERAYASGWQR